jgi:N-acetyl-anhydromuramyl-L-alanine amidase AmpD
MIDLYPHATFVPASPENVGGTLDPRAVRLFVVHVAQGRWQSGLDAWFANPAAQVSAHFSVGRSGVVHQHVGLRRVAWHVAAYNDVAIGIEHLGYSGQKMTSLQANASHRLVKWLHTQFPQVPLHRTANPDGYGVIGHGELGVAGGDHPDCPGAPILDQWNVMLRPPREARRR